MKPATSRHPSSRFLSAMAAVCFCLNVLVPPALALSPNPTAAEIFSARVLAEPLVPLGGEPSAEDNAALASALNTYAERSNPDDASALAAFLDAFPTSKWAASLALNLGMEYYNAAYYSKAMEAYKQAWLLSKDAGTRKEKAVADRSAGELALMYARLGRKEELNTFLKSLEGRPFLGAASERIAGAREGLWTMENKPETAFRCGPLALDRIRISQDPGSAASARIQNSRSSPGGYSLSQVRDLSAQLGMDYQMARRRAGAALILPCVIHWRVGHYAAVIRQENGRFLIEDPTFRNDVWATLQAIEHEASGCFLVPAGPLPEGWEPVSDDVGGTVWGKGETHSNDPRATTPGDAKKGPPVDTCGMAVANAHLMLVSLNITDTPVGYVPPYGPPMNFTVTYNQRESSQPATFTYSHLGQKWTFNWLAYLFDNPNSPNADVGYCVEGGGTLLFTGFSALTNSFSTQAKNQARLVRTSGSSYEMQFPDGSKKLFSQSDGSVGNSRRIFLTRIYDPSGNSAELNYDSSMRIVSISDATGLVTVFSYENADDMYQITKVTDPFGRSASFAYDESGRLNGITDVLGLVSQFNYGAADGIVSMTTPYGTSHFESGESGRTRWLETTDPAGDKDRVEFNEDESAGISSSDFYSLVPTGMFARNSILHARNTFYWDKKAYAEARGDYSKAVLYHWLHSESYSSVIGTLESEKRPFESRIWYNYDGQPQNNEGATVPGSTNLPSKIGRVMDDGSTQLYIFERNARGLVTRFIDPLGRTVSNLYAANGIDLLETRQWSGTNSHLLASYTYDSAHRPLTASDAAGQTTSYSWNAQGQIISVTNPKNETTTFSYYSAGPARQGRLQAVDGPLPDSSDTIAFDYDSFGNVASVTGPDGYVLAFAHDALGRPTRMTYPDGTYEETSYEALDPKTFRDRFGRITSSTYNSIRQLSSVTDPANRTTFYKWCKCGGLKQLVDAIGRSTNWRHDVAGRVTAKKYADGSGVVYAYQPHSGRLKSLTDEQGRIKTFEYNNDDTLAVIAYSGSPTPTPNVSLTYDPVFRRIATMSDGHGITAYAYKPVAPGTLGAGRLASIDGPWPSDTIAFSYDELGRQTGTAIDGVSQTTAYDAAGRVSALTNALGTFTYAYDGATSRIASATHNGGAKTLYSYFPNTLDRRLQRIENLGSDGVTTVSAFDYAYDALGRIVTWKQQQGVPAANARTWNLGYDDADQLISNVVTEAGSTVAAFSYAYDKAGNRTQESLDGAVVPSSYNLLNQLINTGTNLPDSLYEWDTENRLIAIDRGTNRTEFSYDGFGRRVKAVEKTNGNVVSADTYLWCGMAEVEKRDASGHAVQQRYFDQGFQDATGLFLSFTDHLGSIRELVDASGVLKERIDYGTWGNPVFSNADPISPFAYTGHLWHPPSGLSLAPFRGYHSGQGRWLSRDPIGERGGPNLYAYVANNPAGYADPLGLINWSKLGAGIEGKLGLAFGARFGATHGGNTAAAGISTATGVWGNLRGDNGFYGYADANLLRIETPSFTAGAGVSYGFKSTNYASGCPSTAEGFVAPLGLPGTRNVRVRPEDYAKTSFSATLGVIDLGLSLNFALIWEGLMEE